MRFHHSLYLQPRWPRVHRPHHIPQVPGEGELTPNILGCLGGFFLRGEFGSCRIPKLSRKCPLRGYWGIPEGGFGEVLVTQAPEPRGSRPVLAQTGDTSFRNPQESQGWGKPRSPRVWRAERGDTRAGGPPADWREGGER